MKSGVYARVEDSTLDVWWMCCLTFEEMLYLCMCVNDITI
jgi:hypothetical protein